MRQFANVSYSPWANPYTSGPNAGKNIYAAPPQQPVFRRVVTLPPEPVFYHPEVEHVVDEESDDDSQEGMCDVGARSLDPLTLGRSIGSVPRQPHSRGSRATGA